MHTEPTIENTE